MCWDKKRWCEKTSIVRMPSFVRFTHTSRERPVETGRGGGASKVIQVYDARYYYAIDSTSCSVFVTFGCGDVGWSIHTAAGIYTSEAGQAGRHTHVMIVVGNVGSLGGGGRSVCFEGPKSIVRFGKNIVSFGH